LSNLTTLDLRTILVLTKAASALLALTTLVKGSIDNEAELKAAIRNVELAVQRVQIAVGMEAEPLVE
jgi:hypothetical protein